MLPVLLVIRRIPPSGQNPWTIEVYWIHDGYTVNSGEVFVRSLPLLGSNR